MATHVARSDRTTQHTRQDLFGFSQSAGLRAGPSLLDTTAAIRRLWTLGLHIREADPRHWIVRGHSPLPEVHLYSEHEVQHFAARNALHYSPTDGTKTTGITAFDAIKETA